MGKLRLSRREFVAIGSGAAAATWVGVRPARAAIPALRAYHDVTVAQHEANYQAWSAQGYRPISVSIYGTTASPSLAAVWVQRTGPAYAMGSNLNAQQFVDFFNLCAAFNYRFTQISATGPANDPRYVIVAEVSSIGIPLTRQQLTSGSDAVDTTIQYWLKWARTNNQIPRSIAIHGTAADPRYAVVFEPNTAGVLWNAAGLNETAVDYQKRFNAQLENRGRPVMVPVSPEARFASLFRGDVLTQSYVAKHDLTAAGYQIEFDAQIASGRYPIYVSGGGSGASRRFSALFVPSESVASRSLTKQGADRGPRIDAVIEGIMSTQQVRQATLAIFNNRKLLYARAFTRAESGYPIATPTTLFRQASCTKTLTAMLILRLVQEGRLALSDRLQTHLNLRTPTNGNPVDSRFGTITIHQLLKHQSGVMRDPPIASAAAVFGVWVPTKAQAASYVASQMLSFAPGTSTAYSNMAYILLGMVAERLLGISYVTALRSRVCTPLGVTRIRQFAALPESQPADEARYDASDLSVGPSVVTSDGRIVPRVYGADLDPATWDSTGGLSMAAPDYAKVLASLNVRTGNPVLDPTRIDLMLNNGYGFDWFNTASPRSGMKTGFIWGVSTMIDYVENGMSFVAFFNKDGVNIDAGAIRGAIANTVLPSTDLFPTFGLASF